MNCAQTLSLLSPYLDGAVTGKEMQLLGRHLQECDSCNASLLSLRQTQQLLASVASRKAPKDLGLKLRLAISREAARPRLANFDLLRMRLENVLQASMAPVGVGLAAAVLIFGTFMGFSPLPLQAGNSDVPMMLTSTAPELQQSVFGTALNSVNDESLVVEAYVDSNGRIEDYRVLSNQRNSSELSPPVKSMLVNVMTFSRFRPATSMGRPTPGHAILSFSRISVRG